MVYMGNPGAVERDEAPGVDGAREDILGYKDTLVPEEDLLLAHVRVRGVSALADALEPVIVGIGAVRSLEPFVDQEVGRIVVEFLAHELAHREAGRQKFGVAASAGRHGG